MPDTEAGKRLWEILDKLMAVMHGIAIADLPENIAAASKTTDQVKAELEKLIDAIEAEAVQRAHAGDAEFLDDLTTEIVAAERARIRAAVKLENLGASWVLRAAVLAIIDQEDA